MAVAAAAAATPKLWLLLLGQWLWLLALLCLLLLLLGQWLPLLVVPWWLLLLALLCLLLLLLGQWLWLLLLALLCLLLLLGQWLRLLLLPLLVVLPSLILVKPLLRSIQLLLLLCLSLLQQLLLLLLLLLQSLLLLQLLCPDLRIRWPNKCVPTTRPCDGVGLEQLPRQSWRSECRYGEAVGSWPRPEHHLLRQKVVRSQLSLDLPLGVSAWNVANPDLALRGHRYVLEPAAPKNAIEVHILWRNASMK